MRVIIADLATDFHPFQVVRNGFRNAPKLVYETRVHPDPLVVKKIGVLTGRIFSAQVVELQSKFTHQPTHRGVLRIDVFAAQFRELIVGKKIAETEHPSTRAAARFADAGGDAALLQPIRADQSRRAGPDDDDIGRVRPARGGSEDRRYAGARRGGKDRFEKAAPVPSGHLEPLDRFVRAAARSFQPGSYPQSAVGV